MADFGPIVGAFTRDYRHNAENARILITVPACLEILLFSSTPEHRKWVKRLRYVIFDEVHCMREGGVKESGATESNGAIWEHCLLLIRLGTSCNLHNKFCMPRECIAILILTYLH